MENKEFTKGPIIDYGIYKKELNCNIKINTFGDNDYSKHKTNKEVIINKIVMNFFHEKDISFGDIRFYYENWNDKEDGLLFAESTFVGLYEYLFGKYNLKMDSAENQREDQESDCAVFQIYDISDAESFLNLENDIILSDDEIKTIEEETRLINIKKQEKLDNIYNSIPEIIEIKQEELLNKEKKDNESLLNEEIELLFNYKKDGKLSLNEALLNINNSYIKSNSRGLLIIDDIPNVRLTLKPNESVKLNKINLEENIKKSKILPKLIKIGLVEFSLSKSETKNKHDLIKEMKKIDKACFEYLKNNKTEDEFLTINIKKLLKEREEEKLEKEKFAKEDMNVVIDANGKRHLGLVEDDITDFVNEADKEYIEKNKNA